MDALISGNVLWRCTTSGRWSSRAWAKARADEPDQITRPGSSAFSSFPKPAISSELGPQTRTS
jgi:hypothetical protein